MDENQNFTDDTQLGAASQNLEGASGVDSTVEVKPEQSLTLEEINASLGKDFKDKESALKSLKDTMSFVGKRKEDYAKELAPDTQNLANELKQIKDNLFFAKNPELETYRDAYNKVGGNPEEFFTSKEFKPIFDAARGYDESQKAKTVLNSNPRIAFTKDSMVQAKELLNNGRTEDAQAVAARAVLSAYGIEG